MTVSQSIITWLKGFNPADYWKMKSIDTDVMHGSTDYSLVKEPITNVKSYLSGKKECTDHYTIVARLNSQTNPSRIENGAWGEALTGWIEDHNRNKVFPALESGTVQSIGVSTPLCIGRTETNNSIYHMTIAIKYVKEN